MAKQLAAGATSCFDGGGGEILAGGFEVVFDAGNDFLSYEASELGVGKALFFFERAHKHSFDEHFGKLCGAVEREVEVLHDAEER